MLVVLILLVLISVRYEYVFPLNNQFGLVVGLSIIKSVIALAFLYVCSIYASYFGCISKGLLKSFYYVIVGLICLFFSFFYKIKIAFTDPVIVVLSVIFLFILFIRGEFVFDNIKGVIPLKKGEINKAFLEYPPKRYSDFLFFYIIIVVFMLMPGFIEMLWTDIILK